MSEDGALKSTLYRINLLEKGLTQGINADGCS